MGGAARRLHVVGLAALVAVAVACTSGDSPEPAASPTPPTEATVVATASTTAALPRRPPPPEAGALVVDVESGAIATLYELADLTPDLPLSLSRSESGVVWLTGADGVARRFLPDGVETESIAGVAVIEGVAPKVRAMVEPGGGLSLEVDGEPSRLSESAFGAVLAPDGRAVAYLEERDAGRLVLLVASVGGGAVELLDDVQLCGCEEQPPIRWSPSGEFIAVSDFGLGGDAGEDRGGFVVRADGGEPARLVVADPEAVIGWLAGEESTLLVQVVSSPMLYDALAGDTRPLLGPGQVARGTSRLSANGRDVQVWTPDGGTALADPVAGVELERWTERGLAVLTPFGPAMAVQGPELTIAPIPGCWGVWIEHPSLPEAECVRGAEQALWSPDGSMLALLSDRGPFDRWLEFWTFGEQPIRVLVPPTATLDGWMVGGRYLLVTWGFGSAMGTANPAILTEP